MRIAVISDVHANFNALAAVLDDMQQRGVDAVWCLGDLVGRGFQATATVAELRSLYNRQSAEHRRAWLCGNHEMLLLGRTPMGWLEVSGSGQTSLTASGDNAFAIKTLLDNRDELKNRPELLDWLGQFPTHARPNERVYLAHAAYTLHDDGRLDEDNTFRIYLLQDATVSDMLARLQRLRQVQSGLVMAGHTHISGAWRYTGHEAARTRDLHFDLRRELVYINPGSVGFPRGPDCCPVYVVLTTSDAFDTLTLEWVTVAYDIGQFRYPHDYPDVYRAELERCRQKR